MSNNKIKKAREGMKKVAVKAEVEAETEASSRVVWKKLRRNFFQNNLKHAKPNE